MQEERVGRWEAELTEEVGSEQGPWWMRRKELCIEAGWRKGMEPGRVFGGGHFPLYRNHTEQSSEAQLVEKEKLGGGDVATQGSISQPGVVKFPRCQYGHKQVYLIQKGSDLRASFVFYLGTCLRV